MQRPVPHLRRALFGVVAGAMLAFPVTQFASAADSGSSGGGGTEPLTCNKGFVYDPKTQVCVPQQSRIIDDDALADYAYALTKENRFNEALGVLDLVADESNPKVLNYRGYITRKLGDVDGGIGFYLAGLKLDPNYVQLREYLGEAYVVKGRLDLAREQLSAIGHLCGTDCKHYVTLAAYISGDVTPEHW